MRGHQHVVGHPVHVHVLPAKLHTTRPGNYRSTSLIVCSVEVSTYVALLVVEGHRTVLVVGAQGRPGEGRSSVRHSSENT